MLLNRQKGFTVSPTVDPCTKGLWIWPRPIYGKNEKDKTIPLLLIDTQGIRALDTDLNLDMHIFILAFLLSSSLLYNSIGGIDESTLQNLNFITNLSKFIKLKSDDMETDPDELSKLFPSFLWILRDFSLQLKDEDNAKNITPKEYLEEVLENTKNLSDPKNKIRKLIKTYFKDRDCYTLVRPMLDEKNLQKMEDLPPYRLRLEFLEQIIELRKKILNRVKIKTLNGKALNGEMYLNFIKGLIGALNSGNVLIIENIWLSICKAEIHKAFEEAEQIYEDYFDDVDDTLDNIYKESKKAALEHFNKKVFGFGEIAEEYKEKLKIKIKEKYHCYLEEKKGQILRVLNKWQSILEQRIQNNEFKTIDDITELFIPSEEKLNEFFLNYSGINEYFYDFKVKILTFAGNYFSKKAESEKKLLEEENEQKLKKLQNELENAKNSFSEEKEKMKLIITQNKIQINDLQEELKQTKDALILPQKEKEKEMKQEKNSRIKEPKDKIDELEKIIKSLTMENEQLKKKVVDLETYVKSLRPDATRVEYK